MWWRDGGALASVFSGWCFGGALWKDWEDMTPGMEVTEKSGQMPPPSGTEASCRLAQPPVEHPAYKHPARLSDLSLRSRGLGGSAAFVRVKHHHALYTVTPNAHTELSVTQNDTCTYCFHLLALFIAILFVPS